LGGAGSDTFVFGASFDFDDKVEGGDDNDTLETNAIGAGGDINFLQVTSVETLTLGTGTSRIGTRAQTAGIRSVNLDTGNANNDVLTATDFTTGRTVTLGSGNDSVAFGTTAGNDTIVASNGALTANDTINFGAGSDTINASGAAQTLDLDLITGLDSVVMAGTTNADTSSIQFESIAATTVQTVAVDGSAMSGTNDALTVDTNVTNTGGTSFNITGSGGNDSLEGGASADTIVGGTGNDTVSSGGGNDVISSTSGTNNVSGGAGNNHVTTGDGTDTIATTTGTDTVLAGGGNDSITTGAGNDTIEGGAGNDTNLLTKVTNSVKKKKLTTS
jgi:Ca2+-binding RTX toxin-like protein